MGSEKNNEIILRQVYGSTTRQVTFLRSPETNALTIIDNKKKTFLLRKWFANIFLPKGYPESVSKDYIAYQIWDTLQAFCSTITGILATQEVLRGVGVGSESATPLAATITWIIKDGCGHIGRIVFASTHGTNLDSYSKKWRWYADILNDVAMCLELGLSYMRSYTTVILCCSTVMRSIVGVAGGATRAAMTQHHATRGNLADVSAKDSAQETIVNLVASITALLIITTFKDSHFLNILFILLIFLHVVFNYKAVRAACLRTFNEPRLLLCIDMFIRTKEYQTPEVINDLEPIVFHNHFSKTKLNGFQIKIGCSIKEIIANKNIDCEMVFMNNVFKDKNYILLPDLNKKIIYIALKEKATVDDILCSYFQSVIQILCTSLLQKTAIDLLKNSINIESCIKLCKEFEKQIKVNDFTNEKYLLIDAVVSKNWNILYNGLTAAGWDLKTHLLIVDEWRICNTVTDTNLQETKKDL